MVALLAACGHAVKAVSPAQARETGEAKCRPLHGKLEAMGGLGRARALMIGTLVREVSDYPGYTDSRDLGYEFAGCVRAAWTVDLGPKPPVPEPWR
jgi:hypothetical protein